MARAKPIQRPHLNQAFKRALSDLAQVYASGKIGDAAEVSVAARRDNKVHRRLSDVFYRAQTKANGSVLVGSVFNHKVVSAGVNVRREHIQAHGFGFGYVKRAFIDIVLPRGNQGGHIFNRIVILQIGGLHRDHAVIRRVAFIKAVMRKTLPIRENGFGVLPGNPIPHRPFNELDAVGGDLLFFLFGNRGTQLVRIRG